MAKQRSFMNAVKWAYTANWGERAFSALFTFVLAALLGPRDFGIITIAMIYIMFIQMFLDQGLMTALIQRKHLQGEHLDAVFWMDILLSFVLVGLSILFSRWWASLNHLPGLPSIILALSLTIPIQALSIIQNALLQRELDFKSLALRSNAAVVVGGCVGIAMAFGGFGVWALVGQQVVKDSTALILLWRLSPWRPRFEFSWSHLRELMGFSVSNFVAQLGIFADMQAGAIVLGTLFGPVAVGLYRLADRLTSTVLTATTSAIHSASLPEFSRLQDQPAELRRSVLTCIRLSSVVTLPAMAGLAAVSDPLMATIGPKWVPAADVLKVLCLLGLVMTFAIYTGPLLQALSRPHQLALLEWARTIAGFICLGAAGYLVRNTSIRWEIMGIALARFVNGALLVTPVFLYLLLRLSGISLRQLIASLAPSVIASASVVGSLLLFQSTGWLAASGPSILLTAEVLIGGITGLVVLLRLDTQLRLAIVAMLQRTIGSRVVSKEVV